MKKQENEYHLEYEDYGTPSMYIWAIITIIAGIGLIIVLAGLIAAGAFAISEIIK